MARVDEFGIARQPSGKGVAAVTSMDYWIPSEDVEPGMEREEIIVEETLGGRFPSGADYGTRFWRVAPQLAWRMNSLPRLLSAFLGQPTTAGAGPFTHTHDPTAAGKVPEWMSLFVVRNDPSPAIIDLFFNARGDEFEMVFEPNQAPRLRSTFIALDIDEDEVNPTSTMDVSDRQKFFNCTAQIGVDGGGLTTIVLRRFAIRFSNNHDTDDTVLGSRSLFDLAFGNVDATVEFTPRQALSDHYRRNMQQNPASLKLVLTADNGLAGAANRKVVITVYGAESVEAPAPIQAGAVLKTVPVTARLKLDVAGKFLDVAVTNGIATY